MKTAEHRNLIADRYALQTQLSRGPGSATWLANDIVLDRRVEVEVVRPEAADDPDVVAAIDSATRALARSGGTVLLELLDAGVQDGLPFLVTELAGGTTLDETLRGHGPIAPGEAVEIGRQVLAGVAEAHAVGTVHLDVRPATVVRTPDSIRLRSPGTAQALVRAHRASALPDEGRAMPPEAADGLVDERSDVWGAGALLFELLTGRPPTSAARFVRAERRDVSRALDAVIARALAPDPIDRYADVRTMRDALERAHMPGDTRVPERDPDDDEPVARRGVFRTWLAVPLLVVVVGSIAVAAAVWLGGLEIGGPVGIRIPGDTPSTTAPLVAGIEIERVSAFDPLGDGEENSDNAALAADGDHATVWRSENYFDGQLHKDGVGLLLDLGQTATVGEIRLSTPSPGFSFSVRVGDDADALVAGDVPELRASAETRVQLDDSQGRFVLIWATSIVPTGDGNRVEISEVRIVGPSG